MLLRFSLFVKSVVPLQAFVSDKVQAISAPSPFSMSEHLLGDESIHMCSVNQADSFFAAFANNQLIHAKAVDAIRDALKAFQV